MLGVATFAGSQAVTFTDVAGDVSVGSFPHLDISQVDVTNTLTDISFKFTFVGDIQATNWGKYNVVLRNSSAEVDNDIVSNPWDRNYFLSGGANAFIGSWVDAPSMNQQNWIFSGGNWILNGTVDNVITANTVTLTASLASLGINAGDTILFDVVSTGGGNGDTAVDSLTGVSPTSWQQNVELQGYAYTAVPEPATMAILGLGAAALIRKRRK